MGVNIIEKKNYVIASCTKKLVGINVATDYYKLSLKEKDEISMIAISSSSSWFVMYSGMWVVFIFYP